MRVALYVRVSSDKQDVDLSLSAQLRALRDYAARNGYQVIREFVDEAETGKLNLDDVAVRIRDLRQRQERLQARRIEIENQMSDRKVELADFETVSLYVDDLSDILREGSLTERKAFIRGFVREIRVTSNEAVLTYTMPLLPEKVLIEKEGVLPIVQYGGR